MRQEFFFFFFSELAAEKKYPKKKKKKTSPTSLKADRSPAARPPSREELEGSGAGSGGGIRCFEYV